MNALTHPTPNACLVIKDFTFRETMELTETLSPQVLASKRAGTYSNR